jgi:hypothetical protein
MRFLESEIHSEEDQSVDTGDFSCHIESTPSSAARHASGTIHTQEI